jgi:NAD(P)-dependent dehydrogenase (short-subunit alcohol dehydrogenase family)
MFSTIASMELGRYGVRSNAIAPAARTRLTEATPGLDQVVKAPDDPSQFDIWDPANVSPLVAYLSTEDCPFTGQAFFVQGGVVRIFKPYTMEEQITKDGRFTVDELVTEMKQLEDHQHTPEVFG